MPRVLIASLLDMFGIVEPNSTAKGIIALPVGVYEMSLAAGGNCEGFSQEES